MLRVVYEVRTLVNDAPAVCRHESRLAPQDVDVVNSTIKGQRVKILHVERYEPTVCRARAAKAPPADCGWMKIHDQISKRLQASRYHLYFEEPLRVLAKDLEWDATVRRAGYAGTPFVEMWEKFRKSVYASFWWSRNTRGMITRMSKEEWLLKIIKPTE